MKERCPVCGRKKAQMGICKACKSDAEEQFLADYSAVHNINFMIHPFVNLILTNKRLLVFEDLSSVGMAAGGGAVGFAVGKAAEKIVGRTLGRNGTLKISMPLSTVIKAEIDESKKAARLIVSLADGKIRKFTPGCSPTDKMLSIEEFVRMINSAAKADDKH